MIIRILTYWFRWNQWLDRSGEIFRFPFLLSIIILCLVTPNLINIFYNFEWLNAIGVLIMGVLGIGRWAYLIKDKKK